MSKSKKSTEGEAQEQQHTPDEYVILRLLQDYARTSENIGFMRNRLMHLEMELIGLFNVSTQIKEALGDGNGKP